MRSELAVKEGVILATDAQDSDEKRELKTGNAELKKLFLPTIPSKKDATATHAMFSGPGKIITPDVKVKPMDSS
jgi:hypothetical protein